MLIKRIEGNLPGLYRFDQYYLCIFNVEVIFV